MDSDQFPFSKIYDWDKRKQIGKGGFGTVFKVRNKKTNEEVAVKQIDMSKFDEEFKLEALKSEIKAQKTLKSENTVTMYDCQMGKKYTYMVLELCNTDLKLEIQRKGGKLGEDQGIYVLTEILEGFKILLDKGYIHRDVKPQNILVKGNCYKIADYGFSKKLKKIQSQKLVEVCGSPLYMSPQLLYNMEYSSKCDIWSIGLMFYQMIFGFSPWATRHFEVYKRSVINKPVAFPYNCKIGSNVCDFIKRCLKINEEQRISWKEVYEHPLIAHLDKGKPIVHTQVDPELENILIRVQESSSRKFINSEELFRDYCKKFKNKNMNKQSFYQFLREIDPQITTYETKKIFQAADMTKDGQVSLEEFKHFFFQVDYRPVNDIASRRIEEIVKMAQQRGLNIRQFFQLFDKDKSSDIDKEEFYSFIKHIAPAISDFQIKLMWTKFDHDQSGTISMNEFIAQLTRSVPGQGSRIFQNYQKAKRNIQCLQGFMHHNKISSQKLFQSLNLKANQSMKINDFAALIRSINYAITDPQIEAMFNYIDRNCSGTIQYGQLKGSLGI